MNTIQKVQLLGQSIWYDNINRELINNGYIKNLLDIGVTGLTSNPTLFEKAISGGNAYDNDLLELSKSGLSTEQIFESLALNDIKNVADLLFPIYKETDKKDGYVSLEVNPNLAYDINNTIIEAKRIFNKLNRPNIMIKIPGTNEGAIALKELIAEGININVTLIFSQEAYFKVREGYVLGLENLDRKGGDLSQVHSVASFFVSRVDTIIDDQLNGLPDSFDETRRKLLNCLGVSNAKIAYESFNKTFSSKRFEFLLSKGANIQKPLWASTSTKNPNLSDVLYLDSLIGKNTVNTVPDNTLKAFLEHGSTIPTLKENIDQAKQNIDLLEQTGIDLKESLEQLLVDGIKSFTDSYNELIVNIEDKVKSLG